MTTPPSPGVACPLCGEPGSRVVEQISATDLRRFYHRLVPDVDLALPRTGLRFRSCNECELGFFDPAVVGDEVFYSSLSQHRWYYQSDKPEHETAAAHIGTHERVLDIGCGSGEFAALVSTSDYVGIELNGPAVERARALARQVHHGSLESFSATRDDRFDVVCLFQVLEHVPDPARFMALADRHVVDGGRIIVSVPNTAGFIGLEDNQPLNFPPHHLTWWDETSLRRLAQVFSYDVLDISYDPLTTRFARRYATELVLAALRHRLGLPRRRLSASLADRTLRRLAAVGGRVLAPAILLPSFRGRGHSVTAVFRKTTAA